MAGPPPTIDVTFDVVCSKGTYVRTLCADIGEALGVGGHLAGLERRRIGRFGLADAVTLDELAALAERETSELITADDKLFKNLQSQFPFLVLLSSLP